MLITREELLDHMKAINPEMLDSLYNKAGLPLHQIAEELAVHCFIQRYPESTHTWAVRDFLIAFQEDGYYRFKETNHGIQPGG